MYILQHIILNFRKPVWEVNILYGVFVKYAFINFRSHNQYTNLLSVRISMRIISIRPRNITESARKKLKRARDIILKYNTIYLGDQYMNDGRKRLLVFIFQLKCILFALRTCNCNSRHFRHTVIQSHVL